MTHQELCRHFASLHTPGAPLILFNAWDAGSATVIAASGAQAIATSSMAIAMAHGYEDGEALPLQLLDQAVGHIVRCVALPVSVDIEGAYSTDARVCADNAELLIGHGIAGINIEDRVVGGQGLHPVDAQCERIAAIRERAAARGLALFINARTDAFFGAGMEADRAMDEAKLRAAAYARAGASGLFAPGLVALPQIAELAAAIALPLNVMLTPGAPGKAALAAAGVTRISYGPGPYLQAMRMTGEAARTALA